MRSESEKKKTKMVKTWWESARQRSNTTKSNVKQKVKTKARRGGSRRGRRRERKRRRRRVSVISNSPCYAGIGECVTETSWNVARQEKKASKCVGHAERRSWQVHVETRANRRAAKKECPAHLLRVLEQRDRVVRVACRWTEIERIG